MIDIYFQNLPLRSIPPKQVWAPPIHVDMGVHGFWNQISVFLLLVFLVNSLVVLGLPDFYLVAVFNVVADPFGDVLGGGVEGKDFVKVLVIQGAGDFLLDGGEIRDHAVGIQGFGFAVDNYYPVVPVHGLALAFVAEVKAVGRRNL